MLANVASSRHAMDYLDQRGVVSSMIELLKSSAEDPLSNLYVPGMRRLKRCHLCELTIILSPFNYKINYWIMKPFEYDFLKSSETEYFRLRSRLIENVSFY